MSPPLKLYPFQQDTIDRLRDVRSVLIGDDMGLGKTIQGIALDLARREAQEKWHKGKTLVVAPLGVVETWAEQIRKWSNLSVMTIDRRNRTPFLESAMLGEYDIYVTHWPSLRLMPDLARIPWFHVIADEVHNLQNRKTKQSIALKQIPTVFKTGMSGTPAFDKPDDLWSVLNWLYPTFWTSYWNYFDRYVLWVDYNGYKTIVGVANEEELQMQMRGFYIRRRKEEVLHDLPDIIGPTRHYIDLTPKQRRAYNNMRDNMLAWIGEREDEPVNASVVIAQLTRLQQFACAHATFDDEGRMILSDPSSKIDAVMDIIQSAGKQVVVFSQFSQAIELLTKRLKTNKITYGRYVGASSSKERRESVAGFASGKLQVFAATLSAGGTGLDGLQVADTLVFIDRSWSASVNNQAIGRLWRMGQKNAVNVIDIVAANTIDAKRMDQVEMQWGWILKLLGEEDA
jgi:SNF2 family DNA or RNA helicase